MSFSYAVGCCHHSCAEFCVQCNPYQQEPYAHSYYYEGVQPYRQPSNVLRALPNSVNKRPLLDDRRTPEIPAERSDGKSSKHRRRHSDNRTSRKRSRRGIRRSHGVAASQDAEFTKAETVAVNVEKDSPEAAAARRKRLLSAVSVAARNSSSANVSSKEGSSHSAARDQARPSECPVSRLSEYPNSRPSRVDSGLSRSRSMNSTEKFALVMDRSSIKASSSTARKSSKHSGGSSGYRNVEQATMLNENVVPRRKRDRTEQTNNELCSVDDAFAYEYLDKRLDREHRAVEHSDGRRKKCKRRRRSASKCSSKVASTAETSQELCNVATAWDTTSSKAMLEKCTSTDDLAQQTDDARNNLLAGRTSRDAASSNSQRDVVGKVEKWFSDSVPYSPTQELEMDEETVSLPSEATGADSCDIASTVLDMYDLDLPTTDHKESVPTLLPDDRKAVPADTLNGWQNPCKDQQEPPRMVTAAGSYQVLQHEAGCKCNSILSEVHFELDVYTCLLVLDVCADQSTKDNVFQLYAEARKVCCKEPYLNEIRHLVRAAIESKRSVLKTGTNVLRKLAKIEWSMFPRHPGLPGVSVAIQDLQDRNPQVPCSMHLPRATHGKC